MNSEARFLALVSALLMLWMVSTAIRETGDSPATRPAVAVAGPAQPSDLRLKEGIHDLTYGLKELLGLRPVSYRFKDFPSSPKIGLVAQDVEQIIPEVVYLSPERQESGEPRFFSINYGELVPVLIRSIQQQERTIASLTARVETLEAAATQ